MSKNYAYVSLLGSDNYIGAAIVLMYSGKKTNSQYPFYLLVTQNISQENIQLVQNLGYRVIKVDTYQPPQMNAYLNREDADVSSKHWFGTSDQDKGGRHAYTKMLIGGLTQFDKVCFLDLDILVLQNLDDIFNFPSLSTPGWGHLDGTCNSLCMVVEPNAEVFHRLMEYSNNVVPHDRAVADDCYILTWFFKEFLYDRQRCIPETYCYNGFDFKDSNAQLLIDFPRIKSVHMTGGTKPWLHGKQCIAQNIHDDKYIINQDIAINYLGIFIGNLYVDILNQGIADLRSKGLTSLPILEI